MLLLLDFFPKLNSRRFRFLLEPSEEDEADDWLSSLYCLAIEDTLQLCSEATVAVGIEKSPNVFAGGKLGMDPRDSK